MYVFSYDLFVSGLGLDLIILTNALDLDILKMYPHIKNEVFRLRILSEVRARTGQTHR